MAPSSPQDVKPALASSVNCGCPEVSPHSCYRHHCGRQREECGYLIMAHGAEHRQAADYYFAVMTHPLYQWEER